MERRKTQFDWTDREIYRNFSLIKTTPERNERIIGIFFRTYPQSRVVTSLSGGLIGEAWVHFADRHYLKDKSKALVLNVNEYLGEKINQHFEIDLKSINQCLENSR